VDPRPTDPGARAARVSGACSGQTALESLLLVVIILLIVVAVLVWGGAFSKAVGDERQNKTDPAVCATWRCTHDDNCTSLPACGGAGARCDRSTHRCMAA